MPTAFTCSLDREPIYTIDAEGVVTQEQASCKAVEVRGDLGESHDGWFEVFFSGGALSGRAFNEGPEHFCSTEHFVEWRHLRTAAVEIAEGPHRSFGEDPRWCDLCGQDRGMDPHPTDEPELPEPEPVRSTW